MKTPNHQGYRNFAAQSDVDEISRNLIADYVEISSNSIRRAILDQVDDRITKAIHDELTNKSPINEAIRDEIRLATTTIVRDELAANRNIQNMKKSFIRQKIREKVQ